MIWSIAWKNIWRNKARSMVILGAIALGLLAGIFAIAVMAGMVDERVENAIHNEVSHVQIHHQKYLQNDELKYTIPDAQEIMAVAKQQPEVVAATSRLRLNGMANTSGNNAGVIIYGIHPQKEKEVTNVHKNIIEGTGAYLTADDKNKILIGEKMAENLNLVHYELTEEALAALKEAEVPEEVLQKSDTLTNQLFRGEEDFREALQEYLGDEEMKEYFSSYKEASKIFKTRSKIVLTFQDASGHITGGAFRIAGIYAITNSAYEGMNVFVQYDDLARIANMDSTAVHEIALLLGDREKSTEVAGAIQDEFSNITARAWKEIQPDLALTTDYIQITYYIVITFILLALGFGIVNTMLMAVLERIKELGMLMAIGMNKKRVFLMIMLETVFLTLTGAIVGMLLSLGVVALTMQTGIDLSKYAEGFQAIGYSAIVYPKLDYSFFFSVTILVIITGVLSSVYPAIKALKLNPVEATRTE